MQKRKMHVFKLTRIRNNIMREEETNIFDLDKELRKENEQYRNQME